MAFDEYSFTFNHFMYSLHILQPSESHAFKSNCLTRLPSIQCFGVLPGVASARGTAPSAGSRLLCGFSSCKYADHVANTIATQGQPRSGLGKRTVGMHCCRRPSGEGGQEARGRRPRRVARRDQRPAPAVVRGGGGQCIVRPPEAELGDVRVLQSVRARAGELGRRRGHPKFGRWTFDEYYFTFKICHLQNLDPSKFVTFKI